MFCSVDKFVKSVTFLYEYSSSHLTIFAISSVNGGWNDGVEWAVGRSVINQDIHWFVWPWFKCIDYLNKNNWKIWKIIYRGGNNRKSVHEKFLGSFGNDAGMLTKYLLFGTFSMTTVFHWPCNPFAGRRYT